MGFPAHNDTIAPNPLSFMSLHDFTWDCPELSPISTGFPKRTIETYIAACDACETTVTVTAAVLDGLKQALVHDKTSDGSRGRTLMSDRFEGIGLIRKDRLEPSWWLRDVSSLEFTRVPFTAVFWRRLCETSARHRNPLFSRGTYLGPENIGLDWLHIISLGVAQVFLMHMVWCAIHCNVYGLQGTTFQSRFEGTVGRMKNDLKAFYTSEAAQGRGHNQVQQLLPQMFGTNTARAFRLHAAETNGFLFFADAWLPQCGAMGPRLVQYQSGVNALVRIVNAIRRYPRKMPAETQMDFVAAVAQHFRACKELNEFKPASKHMFLAEMAGRLYSNKTQTV